MPRNYLTTLISEPRRDRLTVSITPALYRRRGAIAAAAGDPSLSATIERLLRAEAERLSLGIED